MATTAAQRAAPPEASAIRTPALVAIERLAKLSAQGVAPHRIADATADILADWRSKHVPSDQIKILHRDIEAGLQAAEEYVAEAESEAAKVAAARQLEALNAARRLLTEELERLS